MNNNVLWGRNKLHKAVNWKVKNGWNAKNMHLWAMACKVVLCRVVIWAAEWHRSKKIGQGLKKWFLNNLNVNHGRLLYINKNSSSSKTSAASSLKPATTGQLLSLCYFAPTLDWKNTRQMWKCITQKWLASTPHPTATGDICPIVLILAWRHRGS